MTWVLLRGLSREAGHWGDFAKMLERADGGAAVLAVDLPGNGIFFQERSPIGVAAMVAACRTAVAAQGHRPPFRLIGLSLGAMVALEWSVRHPEEIAGALLINTSLRGVSPFYRRLHWRNYLRMLTGRLHSRGAVDWERLVFTLTSNGETIDVARVAQWVALAQKHPVTLANTVRQLVAAARYRVPRLRPPVCLTILASQRDRLVDVTCSRALATRWQCTIFEHPLAGHDLPLDDPGWVVERALSAWPTGVSRERIADCP